MFKHISILFLFISVTMLVFHMVIPHHEHGKNIYFGYVDCVNSEDHKDGTAHQCSLSEQYMVRQQNTSDSEHHCSEGLKCDLHFPPIMLFLGDFFSYTTLLKSELPHYLDLYTSADIYSITDVRGPPQI